MIVYAFINNGTDCYMNSTLQVLLTEYKLINYLYKNREIIINYKISLEHQLILNKLLNKSNKINNLEYHNLDFNIIKSLLGINLLKSITIILYKIFNDLDLHDEHDNIIFINNKDKLFIENEEIIPYEVNMKCFKKIIIKYFGDNFSIFYGQKDSHEFLNKLLDFLNCGLKMINLFDINYNNEEKLLNNRSFKIINNERQYINHKNNISEKNQELTIIDKIYSGNIYTEIKSLECEHSSKKKTDYDCLELNIPINLDIYKENPLPDNTDIQTYINEHFKEEKLFNENKWKCEECNKYCNAIIKTYVGKTPETLTILLKRFDNDGNKIEKNVFVNKNITIIGYDNNNINYTLQSSIMHIGNTLLSGHYLTLVKYFNNEWFFCDDNNIKKQKNFNINNGFYSSNTYILFYKKLD